MGLNTSGRVVMGAGNTGVVGVLIAHGVKNAGDIVDVMTDGEIVEFADGDAGVVYSAATDDGAIDDTAASDAQVEVGFTAEATRLIVRVQRALPASA